MITKDHRAMAWDALYNVAPTAAEGARWIEQEGIPAPNEALYRIAMTIRLAERERTRAVLKDILDLYMNNDAQWPGTLAIVADLNVKYGLR